ncbi:MAG: hypothetical protein GTO71_09370 [Woeseiaceae bacterium]|nr:hypothetical protein [Woeseiaceae bacterium]NIP21296.1 hypothetical protein [Woeseiaceae bacterium]NIS90268.1 hypothetical protein [Woeseiaceae bacterium]
MSEETTEIKEEPPLDAHSEQVFARTERMFLRLTFWQTVLSVAGVFIAIVALYAALTESAAVRQQTAAAVWPFVQFSTEDSDSGESAEFTMYFTNTGVGPARMRTMRLVIDGESIRDWEHAVTILGGQLTDHVSRNFVSDRVLSPDEEVVSFSTTDPDLARQFRASVASPDSFIAFCYCSIFNECWLADSRKDIQNPETVEACPDFGSATFRD